jgi:glycosyltransferase involved in cell wall biosynthesis
MAISVAIVIPTRNRADLAAEAVRSLLAIDDERLQVVVSNNSSDPEHVSRLENFCARVADRRVLHLRPAHSLPMAEHWDWAIQQTLERTDATHVGLHYDRRVSLPQLPLLFDRVAERPDVTITYYLNIVYGGPSRFYVHHQAWTGGLYEMRTTRALELASTGMLTDLWPGFPVLVNCVTPRPVFERVARRYGNFCASTTPDAAFGLRLAGLEERYLHFDRSLGIHYAFERSNGLAYLRGDGSPVFADFMKLFGDRPWLDAAPIPGLNLGQNIFWHEYALARRGSEERFPPMDMDAYLNDVARGLDSVTDETRRAGLREQLVRHGWREPETPPPLTTTEVGPIRRVLRAWRHKLLLFRLDHVTASPAERVRFGYKREAAALQDARTTSIPPLEESAFLTPFHPVRLQ